MAEGFFIFKGSAREVCYMVRFWQSSTSFIEPKKESLGQSQTGLFIATAWPIIQGGGCVNFKQS